MFKKWLDQLRHSEEFQQLRQLNDKWLQEVQLLRSEAQVNQIHLQQLALSLEEANKEKDIMEERYISMKSKFDESKKYREYYEMIGFPSSPLKDIEETLKNVDKFTIKAIQEYLKADNQELIKNLAQTLNVGNQPMVIAYKDGAIGRNEALIKKLDSLGKDTFHDKLTGMNRVVGKANKES